MPIISGGTVMPGGLGPFTNAGAPSAGVDETQTATLGGTGGTSTFRLILSGVPTGTIAWSATNGTLLANINAALDARFGTAQIVATDVALTAGIGTLLLTFSGSDYAKTVMPVMTRLIVSGALTIAIVETTAGVTATARGAEKGATLIDTTNGLHYTNTGTTSAPTWTKTGTQT